METSVLRIFLNDFCKLKKEHRGYANDEAWQKASKKLKINAKHSLIKVCLNLNHFLC